MSPPHAPKPPPLLAVNTFAVLCLITVVVAESIALIVYPLLASPFAFFGAVCFIPVIVVFGAVLFRSVFSRSLPATRAATLLFFAGSAFSIFGTAANLAEHLYRGKGGLNRSALMFALAGFGISVYPAFCGYLSSKWLQQLCRARAAAEGDPVCPACGYDLTGLPADHRCPECGRGYSHRPAEGTANA
jgi:hypothetical protein